MHAYEITIYWAIAIVSVLLVVIIGLFGWSLARSQQYLRRQTVENHRAELALQEERNRLAMDLHDEAGPLLTGAMRLLRKLQQEAKGQEKTTEKLEAYLEQLACCTRRLAHNLLPASIFRKGLRGSLEELLLECRAFHPFQTEAVFAYSKEPVPTVAMQVYRLVQEMVSNAVKHSGGSTLLLRLAEERGYVVLHFQDNGRGFDPACVRKEGMGLRNLQLRAVLIGGELRCLSNASGTAYSLQIPFHKWRQPEL
jgi:signal transduction histidine kinase